MTIQRVFKTAERPIFCLMETAPRTTFVYIAKCCDGSYYTGVSIDITKRLEQHNCGKGARYTAARRPVKLVYQETCDTLSAALKRERQIKGWKRAQKHALILKGRRSRRKLRER